MPDRWRRLLEAWVMLIGVPLGGVAAMGAVAHCGQAFQPQGRRCSCVPSSREGKVIRIAVYIPGKLRSSGYRLPCCGASVCFGSAPQSSFELGPRRALSAGFLTRASSDLEESRKLRIADGGN